MSFNAISENKILAKISGFKVTNNKRIRLGNDTMHRQYGIVKKKKQIFPQTPIHPYIVCWYTHGKCVQYRFHTLYMSHGLTPLKMSVRIRYILGSAELYKTLHPAKIQVCLCTNSSFTGSIRQGVKILN